jgi:hypothetical protein
MNTAAAADEGSALDRRSQPTKREATQSRAAQDAVDRVQSLCTRILGPAIFSASLQDQAVLQAVKSRVGSSKMVIRLTDNAGRTLSNYPLGHRRPKKIPRHRHESLNWNEANNMWTYFAGPLLALFPRRWREALPFSGYVNWARATAISGIAEAVGALVILSYWYSYAMSTMAAELRAEQAA